MSHADAMKDAEIAALRELMNVYNVGGWTDAVEPMRRALAAEAELARLRAEADAERICVLELRAQLDRVNATAIQRKDELTRLRAELERARTALLDANSICRSAFAIAHHVAVEHGTAELGTFFGRFSERAHESLKRQHDAILAAGGYPITQEPPA